MVVVCKRSSAKNHVLAITQCVARTFFFVLGANAGSVLRVLRRDFIALRVN